MSNIGFGDGTLNASDSCITFTIAQIMGCSKYSGTLNDTTTLYAHNFCGQAYTAQHTQTNYHWNGNSKCSDCFTIDKTANTQSINAYDTITYTITVTANNGSAQSVIVYDSLPNNFNVIGTNPFPAYLTLNPQDTVILNVQGYFSAVNDTAGACNVAILTNSQITISDTVCVQVNPACFKDTYEVIPDSVYASTAYSNGVFANDTILLTGRFYIDSNFVITNCVIITYPGSNIIVLGNATLTVLNTKYYSCTNMWKGIYLEENANIQMQDSRVYDAENGVWARKSNRVVIENSGIFNCITGVRMEEPIVLNNSIYNNCHGRITGTEIAQISKLKAPYGGQTFVDTVMYATIYLQNVKFDIGDIAKPKNILHDAANGIIAHNAITRIRNTEAYYIRPNSTNGNKRSAAFVAIGDKLAALCDMTILPLANPATATVHESWRGVLSSYANITVIGNKVLNVALGVSVNNNNDYMHHANVYSNRIEASTRGISFNFNAGSNYNNATDNIIIISGNTLGNGITLREINPVMSANYKIEGNHINLIEARAGILSSFCLGAKINYNIINQLSVGANTLPNIGIQILGSDTVTVTCNALFSNYPPDTNFVSTAIYLDQSKHFDVSCNTMKGHNLAAYLGGNCFTKNVYKSNKIDSCGLGLYLNSSSIIGTQLQKGNRWLKYFGPEGAIHAGAYQFSQFIVHDTIGTQFHPITNPSFWFTKIVGTPENCNTNCIAQFTNADDTLLIAHILSDSIVAKEFNAEARTMALQDLFTTLQNNYALRMSDTTFNQFYLLNLDSSYGQAYNVNERIQSALSMSSYLQYLLTINDSLKQTKQDSIVLIDSLSEANPYNDYNAIRTSLLNAVSNLDKNSAYLYTQQKNASAADLTEAHSINNLIVTKEICEENKKVMNDVVIKLEESTLDEMETELQITVPIANQCPSAGGPNVYQARNIVDYFNDSAQYDDVINCLLLGYFRSGNIMENYTSLDFKVNPNPARDKIQIEITGNTDLKTRLAIINMLGKTMEQWDIEYGKTYTIYLHHYVDGVYIISLANANTTLYKKLVIQK
nr:T9SS type A sorting domain-containing protein [Bacteroidota bacterium]